MHQHSTVTHCSVCCEALHRKCVSFRMFLHLVSPQLQTPSENHLEHVNGPALNALMDIILISDYALRTRPRRKFVSLRRLADDDNPEPSSWNFGRWPHQQACHVSAFVSWTLTDQTSLCFIPTTMWLWDLSNSPHPFSSIIMFLSSLSISHNMCSKC